MSRPLSVAFGMLLAFGLTGLWGCGTKNRSVVATSVDNTAWTWSRADALRVLQTAAESEDPSLRALALPALVREGDQWLVRGWHDPSVAVQRAIATSHPKRLSAEQLIRPGADLLAVAWVLQEYPITDPILQQVTGQKQSLVAQMLGLGTQIPELLVDLKDGMIPPEPMFIDVLVRSEIDGIGEAMATGALLAEDEMRLPLAVASLQRSPEAGMEALNEVLRDADEMTMVFAVESLTYVGGEPAVAWLKRAAKEDGAVREYAKAALMALGYHPFDEALGALSSPDRDLRAWAARCFEIASVKRPLPQNVILALQGTWRDESVLVRHAVTDALIAGAGVISVPFAAPAPEAEVDTLAVLVAGSWLSHHDNQSE